jgi:hypothetical protein
MKMLLHRRHLIQITVCLLIILTAWIAQIGISEFTGDKSMVELSEIPNNDAVRWDGTRFGLLPTLLEKTESIIKEGQTVVPTLLDAIADPHRFVTAHVLLTKIAGVQYETFPSWNGLEVGLQAKGEVSINSDQRFDLARRWERWYQSKPRPKILPPSD